MTVTIAGQQERSPLDDLHDPRELWRGEVNMYGLARLCWRGGTVDGISYTQEDRVRSRWTARPMFSLHFDNDNGRAEMYCSTPPTEEELDHYVRTGEAPDLPPRSWETKGTVHHGDTAL